jgi:hypothetical protein
MVDIATQLAAVDRGIRTTEVDGVASYVQTLGQTYPSALADVWSALTDADRIARWFLPVSGDLRLGGRYQFEGNAGGEVLACAPPADGSASFRVSWSMDPATPTYLTVRLAGDDTRTTLELEHVAPVDALPPGMWEQFGPAGTGIGWESGLLGLSLHLSAPEFRDEFDATAWTVSAEGRSFMRGSADAWAVAHAADGAELDAAKAAADATYRMYVGE